MHLFLERYLQVIGECNQQNQQNVTNLNRFVAENFNSRIGKSKSSSEAIQYNFGHIHHQH